MIVSLVAALAVGLLVLADGTDGEHFRIYAEAETR